MERIGLNEAVSSWHYGEQQVHWICVKSTVILLLVTSAHLPALSSAPSTIHLTSQAVVSLKSSESYKAFKHHFCAEILHVSYSNQWDYYSNSLCSIV